MALHWILLFVAVILVGLIAWHSTRFSTAALRKVFERRTNAHSDHVLGLDLNEDGDMDLDHDILDAQCGSDAEDTTACAPASSEKSQKKNAQVICLNIKASDGETFLGDSLVPALRTAGLYFGDLNIFHYEVEKDGDFYPLFSLASAFEPGSFNLDTINEYATPGLTLFMETDAVDEPSEVFALMLETAKTVAGELQGIVCDDKWMPLTEAGLKQYHLRIG